MPDTTDSMWDATDDERHALPRVEHLSRGPRGCLSGRPLLLTQPFNFPARRSMGRSPKSSKGFEHALKRDQSDQTGSLGHPNGAVDFACTKRPRKASACDSQFVLGRSREAAGRARLFRTGPLSQASTYRIECNFEFNG